ncbi:MAG: hypothetical protein FD177_607 [Desulfovibrionaceae bacterium]|nr:MAG: hypothetical protein FD177_607 [Desulfovibrionaceae bacterium]
MMKKVAIFDEAKFTDLTFHSFLVHDSENFKIINFNFKAGQTMPIHSHDIEGEFLSEDDVIPAKTGDVLVSDISEPHGVHAVTDMRVLVTIAPPI